MEEEKPVKEETDLIDLLILKTALETELTGVKLEFQGFKERDPKNPDKPTLNEIRGKFIQDHPLSARVIINAVYPPHWKDNQIWEEYAEKAGLGKHAKFKEY